VELRLSSRVCAFRGLRPEGQTASSTARPSSPVTRAVCPSGRNPRNAQTLEESRNSTLLVFVKDQPLVTLPFQRPVIVTQGSIGFNRVAMVQVREGDSFRNREPLNDRPCLRAWSSSPRQGPLPRWQIPITNSIVITLVLSLEHTFPSGIDRFDRRATQHPPAELNPVAPHTIVTPPPERFTSQKCGAWDRRAFPTA